MQEIYKLDKIEQKYYNNCDKNTVFFLLVKVKNLVQVDEIHLWRNYWWTIIRRMKSRVI